MMRFAGIDVGAERHMLAMVGEEGEVLCRSSRFGEDASGHAHLFELLGPPEGCLVALEATGHYWRNLFVALLAKGYAVAVLNPLRTRRFAEEELQRTKTDAIDALGIARFAAQKRPPAAQLPDVATEELREFARLRERLQEDFASRLRQLHRAVDLGFPGFTRHVHTLESQLATTILSRYPTAVSFRGASVKKIVRIVYDGSHKIGEELARALIDEAANSVGSYHSEPYRLRIKYLCEDLDVLRGRLKGLARDIERKLDDHEVGKLLTTIDGIGSLNGRLPHRRTGRSRALSQRGCDRELCRRCATAAAIREEAVLLGQPDNPVGQRSAAQGTLDGGSQRRAMQSVAASVLRTSSGRGQTRQGRRHRSDEKARWLLLIVDHSFRTCLQFPRRTAQ